MGMPNEPIELPLPSSRPGVRDGGGGGGRNLEVTLYRSQTTRRLLMSSPCCSAVGPARVDVDIGDGAAITRLEIRGGTIYLSASVAFAAFQPMLVALALSARSAVHLRCSSLLGASTARSGRIGRFLGARSNSLSPFLPCRDRAAGRTLGLRVTQGGCRLEGITSIGFEFFA